MKNSYNVKPSQGIVKKVFYWPLTVLLYLFWGIAGICGILITTIQFIGDWFTLHFPAPILVLTIIGIAAFLVGLLFCWLRSYFEE